MTIGDSEIAPHRRPLEAVCPFRSSAAWHGAGNGDGAWAFLMMSGGNLCAQHRQHAREKYVMMVARNRQCHFTERIVKHLGSDQRLCAFASTACVVILFCPDLSGTAHHVRYCGIFVISKVMSGVMKLRIMKTSSRSGTILASYCVIFAGGHF